MEVSVISDDETSHVFTVTNKEKCGSCTCCPLFRFYFTLNSEILILAQNSNFVLHMDYLTISNSKTVTRKNSICDPLYTNVAALAAASLREAEELTSRFSTPYKAFLFNNYHQEDWYTNLSQWKNLYVVFGNTLQHTLYYLGQLLLMVKKLNTQNQLSNPNVKSKWSHLSHHQSYWLL